MQLKCLILVVYKFYFAIWMKRSQIRPSCSHQKLIPKEYFVYKKLLKIEKCVNHYRNHSRLKDVEKLFFIDKVESTQKSHLSDEPEI